MPGTAPSTTPAAYKRLLSPLDRQDLKGFLGVNLRQDRLTLADLELAKAINADLHTQPGSIILRLGRTKQFATALPDVVIRRVARLNLQRYQVAGQSVYRNQVKILDGLLSPNLFTTLFAYRPLNDDASWAFIADDGVMRKDNSQVTRIWGIAAPAVAPVAQVAFAAAGLTGSYQAAYTYIRLSGAAVAHESNPSATASLALSAQDLALGDLRDPTDAQVTAIGLYRTAAGGALLLLDSRETLLTPSVSGAGTAYAVTHAWEVGVATSALQFHWSLDIGPAVANVASRGSQVWENASGQSEDAAGRRATYLWEIAGYVTTETKRWAYHSSKLDSALGAAAELDNDVPPLASWCTEFQGHTFLCRDAAHPHYLWFSKRFRPEAVPTSNFLEVGSPDDPLQCALVSAGLLGVFSRRTKYRVLGNSTSGFSAVEAISRRGTPAPAAALSTERGIIFVARDGVFLTNLLQPDDELSEAIAPLFYNEDVNGLSHINWPAAPTMAAATWKGRYYLSLPTGTHTQPDTLAVLSVATRKWYFYDHPARSLLFEEDTDQLVGGFTDGFVYVLETGTADAASNIALDCETRDVVGESPELRKLHLWARVDVDTAGAAITADLYVDGVLRRTVTVTGTRKRALIAFPEGSLGYSWRLRFRYTGQTRVRIYGAAVLALPLEAA